MNEALKDFFVGYVRPAYVKLAELDPQNRLLNYFHNPADGLHINEARRPEFIRRFNEGLREEEIKLSTLVCYCASLIVATDELEKRGVEGEELKEAGK